MSQTPAASVLIPTRNRKLLLRDTVRSVLSQSIPVEIIVVDDGSTDGTADFLTDSFPSQQHPVRVIRHSESAGPTVRRNEAAALATSPYLFTIDDDCLVPSRLTFEQTIAGFDHPRIGAVTIPFINILQDRHLRFAAPDTSQRWINFMYFGGMVAFRRSAYLAVGGYRTYYFMHVEEPDLSIRFLQAGYVIRLGSADSLHHLESSIRNQKRLHLLGPRNHLLYEWYNTPMPSLLKRLPMTALGAFWLKIKQGRPDLGLWGLLNGVTGILHEIAKRNAVSPVVYRLSRELARTPVLLSAIEAQLPPVEMPQASLNKIKFQPEPPPPEFSR